MASAASASLLKSSLVLNKSEWVKGQTFLRQPSSVSVVRCNPAAPSSLTARSGSYPNVLVKTARSNILKESFKIYSKFISNSEKMSPRREEKGKSHRTRRPASKYIIEEVSDSDLFIPMSLSSQVASMQSSEPSMQHSVDVLHSLPIPSEDDHGDTSAPEEEKRTRHILKNEPVKIRYHKGRLIIWPDGGSILPSYQATRTLTKIIKKKYTKFWPTYRAVLEDDREELFEAFREKCCWDFRDELRIKLNFHRKCIGRFACIMKGVRRRWEKKGTRPCWIGEEIFQELIVHWTSSEAFKQKSESGKKGRASKVGGQNYTAGNISVAEVARRMHEKLGRAPLLNEIHMETHLKKDGEFVDERAKITQEEYDKQLALWLSEHPELHRPPLGYSIDPSVSFRTWLDVTGGKSKTGKVYGAGEYAPFIKPDDRSLKMRLANGEESSTPPILPVEMLETVKNLVAREVEREVAAGNAEIEEMKRKQIEMQEEMRRRETELREEMRRQTLEYQEAMQIANERTQRIG